MEGTSYFAPSLQILSPVTIADYITAIDKHYRSGIAREHSYRSDLQQLLTALCPGVLVTNEPARIACGAPDYILTRKEVPVGYVEAKDIDTNLGSKNLKEQFDRYRSALDNLVITDYLEFRFFRNREATTNVRIGEVSGGRVKALPEQFDRFKALVKDFAGWQGQTITSPKKLASMMAGKARLLADVIELAVGSDEQTQANTNLREQLEAFKNILIHDITPKGFADLYAQTIAYGMFAARLHDPSLESFTRMEAATLIPKSNPFLRKLFQSISGYDLDGRIAWIVDALADIFRATDVGKLLRGFGRATGREDAFLHFYEDFLAEYDPKLRKSRGVWYTPDAVVKFIVRAVDDILKEEFGLPGGLADSSKVKIKRKAHTKATADRRSKVKEVEVEEEVHRVQVLDPATGTGTFLAEVVRLVHDKFKGQEGMWPQYVEQHLIPRLNGFELLMASYAMAHLKLDLVLRETGYDLGLPHGTPNARHRTDQQRLRVFLTNSLEEAHPDTGTLFASWLSQEANEANAVKRDTPVMVVLGNPPYAVNSTNKGKWIQNAIKKYKQGLKEKKLNLDDDYIKFLRYGQHLIDKTGEGVLAYISNSSFIDGITHRQMRRSLLESFDKIFILDLHGSTNQEDIEITSDENVFDIEQGVSINILVKLPRRNQKTLGEVYHHDLIGARSMKYDYLRRTSINEVPWLKLVNEEPYLFFVPKNFVHADAYQLGFKLTELMPVYSSGVETKCDGISVHFTQSSLIEMIERFRSLPLEDLRHQLWELKEESSGWNYRNAKADIVTNNYEPRQIAFRPFDIRWTILPETSGGFIGRSRYDVMRHLIDGSNIGFLAARQTSHNYRHVFISRFPTDGNYTATAKKLGSAPVFPLYLYPAPTSQATYQEESVRPNLNDQIVSKMAADLGFDYVFKPDELFVHGRGSDMTPLDVMDYCYAVMYSPAYREKYMENLKIDFPRIPHPKDAMKFRALVNLGERLRKLHLLEAEDIDHYITTYPIAGTNEVTRKMTAKSIGFEATGMGTGKVWINDCQYFDQVPETAWNFYIGGYQPAQKWLKDRHGRVLSVDDIRHYQRIIVALTRTAEVMHEVDRVGVL